MKTSRAALLIAALSVGCAPALPSREAERARTVQEETGKERLTSKADAFAASGDTLRAEQYYVAAMAAGGDAHLLIRRLLPVCALGQRFRVALQYAEDYLRQAPRDHEVRLVLGTLYWAIGEPESARLALERVVREAPAEPDAHFALAVVLAASAERRAEALPHFRAYLQAAPAGRYAEQAREGLQLELARSDR